MATRTVSGAVDDKALAQSYPAGASVTVLMPFRRVFSLLRRAGVFPA